MMVLCLKLTLLSLRAFLDINSASFLNLRFPNHRTGFLHIRGVMKKLFGDEVDKTGPVYGVDEEGEIQGAYRPTGHPGVSGFSHKLPVSNFTSSEALVCTRRFSSITVRFKVSGECSCAVSFCSYIHVTFL